MHFNRLLRPWTFASWLWMVSLFAAGAVTAIDWRSIDPYHIFALLFILGIGLYGVVYLKQLGITWRGWRWMLLIFSLGPWGIILYGLEYTVFLPGGWLMLAVLGSVPVVTLLLFIISFFHNDTLGARVAWFNNHLRAAIWLLLAAYSLALFTLAFGLLERYELPVPAHPCTASLEWKGIEPGKSTFLDVLLIKGRPQSIRAQEKYDRWFPYMSYPVKAGQIAGFTQDRVFFRPNGVVDWIEVVVADRGETRKTLNDYVERFGPQLDTAYLNNNYSPPPAGKITYDVLAGPDSVLIWANCGLALITLPSSYFSPVGGPGEPPAEPRPVVLKFRNLDPDSTFKPGLDLDSVVLMEFLFPPTTAAGFDQAYRYYVPWTGWNW